MASKPKQKPKQKLTDKAQSADAVDTIIGEMGRNLAFPSYASR